MATRSGKKGIVEPGKGAATPQIVLFRTGGFASVWDWGDAPAAEGPVGAPFARDADCRLVIAAPAAVLSDAALVITGLEVRDCDVSAITSRLVQLLGDQRLQITGLPNLEKRFDARAVIQNLVGVNADQRIAVFGTHVSLSDIGIPITGLFARDCDALLRVIEAAHFDTRADVGVVVSGAVVRGADSSIVVRGRKDGWIDLRVISTGGFKFDADTLAQILASRSVDSRSDMRLIIAAESVMPKDIALNADSLVSVYVVLIRETHLIQV